MVVKNREINIKITLPATGKDAILVTPLMTKKARTFLTVFAGSIGIIGIALILSLSNRIHGYECDDGDSW